MSEDVARVRAGIDALVMVLGNEVQDSVMQLLLVEAMLWLSLAAGGDEFAQLDDLAAKNSFPTIQLAV